ETLRYAQAARGAPVSCLKARPRRGDKLFVILSKAKNLTIMQSFSEAVDNEVFTSLKTSTTIKVVVYHYCSIFIGTVVVLADNHKGCPYIKPLIVGTGLVPVRMDFFRGLNQY
ncbi:MAG TPA: hypothetical protein ACFYD1_07660, partial [Candidatus Hypogeohydataceae bacterium YC38]